MRCPYCNYCNGWDPEKVESVKGSMGEFFKLPIKMEKLDFFDSQTALLCGCPECKKLFMEV